MIKNIVYFICNHCSSSGYTSLRILIWQTSEVAVPPVHPTGETVETCHNGAGYPQSRARNNRPPVDDNRTRVTGGGECAIFVAVGVYGNLQRRLLEGILALLADNRLGTC